MELTQLLKDDDAVSPVIGVILMVAITVILAAVIASFVLGLGNDATNTNPQASFSFEYEEQDDSISGSPAGVAKISHDGGDTIQNNELYIRGSGFYNYDDSSTSGAAPDYNPPSGWATGDSDRYLGDSGSWPAAAGSGDDSAVVSGDFIYVGAQSDYEMDVVYQSQEGQSSSTLQEDSGPDA